MIKYEWRTALAAAEAEQLADLLRRAAEYDAEPEYNAIAFDDIERSLAVSDGHHKHLVIWMLPYGTTLGEKDQPERIAGIIRLVTAAEGVAEATIVIDPRLRSIGITTLLLERIGLDGNAAEGFWGTGFHTITGWARGNHPAAGRLSNRFLIPRTRRIWKLIRSTDSVEDATAAPVLEQLPGASTTDTLGWLTTSDSGEMMALREEGRVVGAVHIDLDPAESEEFGRCATLTTVSASPAAPKGARRRLLEGAAAIVHEAGLTGVIVHVDSDDAEWVNACRSVGFQHDRTDVRFQLGGLS